MKNSFVDDLFFVELITFDQAIQFLLEDLICMPMPTINLNIEKQRTVG